MAFEGKISVRLSVDGDRVNGVQVASSRRIDACRALVGSSVEAAVESVPLLFSVCAEAQGVAAQQACEVALGVAVGEASRTARQLRVVCEAIDGHAFQIALGWAELVGVPAAIELLRELRQRTARLRALAIAPFSARAGEAPVEAAALRAKITELSGPTLPESPDELRRWAKGAAIGQRAVDALKREGFQDFGGSAVPLLPQLPAAWFEEQVIADPSFESTPSYQGRPAEVGALARQCGHPLVCSLLDAHGNGLLTRFVSRLADLEELVARAETLAQILRGPAEPSGPRRASGRGAAVVETSRGPLAHVVTVEEGRMVAWRVVAPTEWNFHPKGPLAAGLQGVRAHCLHRSAALMIAALDPCVGFEVSLVGAADA